VQNYFNYFTEIEERFQRRRGTLLLLSTLDWALIETWKEAGIPLEAVLRGIDAAMDRYDRRPSKSKKVNSLAFCSQKILASAEEMKEAAVGSTRAVNSEPVFLSLGEVRSHLEKNAAVLSEAPLPQIAQITAQEIANSLAEAAKALAASVVNGARSQLRLEDLERQLTVLEEKLQAALLTTTSEDVLLDIRRKADHDIAPYQSKMNAAQIEQLRRQYVHKKLLDHYKLPRLSLFYM